MNYVSGKLLKRGDSPCRALGRAVLLQLLCKSPKMLVSLHCLTCHPAPYPTVPSQCWAPCVCPKLLSVQLYLCSCFVVAGAWIWNQRDLGSDTSPVVCVALGKLPTSSVKQGLTRGKTWKGHGSTLAHLYLLGEGHLACLESKYRAACQHMLLGRGSK